VSAVTEEEWLTYDLPAAGARSDFSSTGQWRGPPIIPRLMATRLRQLGTERQVMLFGCACCRRIWHLLEERARETVELIEQHDGLPPLRSVRQRVEGADFVPAVGWSDLSERIAAQAVIGLLTGVTALFTGYVTSNRVEERKAQYRLLQDIIGRPKNCPKVDPAWLAWNDGAVSTLVEVLGREDRFSEMPILADALIDAGCPDESILSHLRGPGPHVRGCWVLDLLLGRK
jgi:hypothetical protein